MKILAIADIHGHNSMLKKLKKSLEAELKTIDLMLIAADITDYGTDREAKPIIEELNFAPILAVPGNVDTNSVLNYLEKEKISLHAKKKTINRIEIIGFGKSPAGGIGVLFFEEKKALETLKKLFKGSNPKKTIFLTHCPAKNVLDLTTTGIHAGSESIKKIIEEFQPALHLCGHIHEAFGEEMIGKTKSINIGPVEYGHALIIEIEGETIKTKKIKFE